MPGQMQTLMQTFSNHQEGPLCMQGCVYSSVKLASGARSIYATGSDKVLRELEESTSGNTTATAEVEVDCLLTRIAVPQGGSALHAVGVRRSPMCHVLHVVSASPALSLCVLPNASCYSSLCPYSAHSHFWKTGAYIWCVHRLRGQKIPTGLNSASPGMNSVRFLNC